MFSMNIDYYDFLFAELKKYLLAKSQYSPTVLKKPMTASPQYPQVVLAEITNAHDTMTIDRMEVTTTLGYEVDIFSTNKTISGKVVDNMPICRELSGLADNVLFHYGFRRLSSTPTPTVDTTLYRIVNRYTGKMFNMYNQIF